ncbi:unnamed protein product [Heterobilharzia americana]|nr:unnamed protein product [Heterobilharzia americana]
MNDLYIWRSIDFVSLRMDSASNKSPPVDDQSDVNTNVNSSRRSVNKQLSQPRRTAPIANERSRNNWIYVNRKCTPGPSTQRRVSPSKNQQTVTSSRNLKLMQKHQLNEREVIEPRNSQVQRKKRRLRSGVKALKEIRAFQRSTNLLLRKLPFARLVRSLTVNSLGPRYLDFRWQAICFLALQEAAEAFIVQLFESAQRCAIHARRVTVMSKDLQLVTCLQNIPTTSNFRHLEHGNTQSRKMIYSNKDQNESDEISS